jgi:glycosyltransferase involved in cell wall biosynthesis
MLIVEPSDRNAFVDALEQVIRSAELRHAIGSRARECVPYFDWDAVGARRAEQLQTTELLAL